MESSDLDSVLFRAFAQTIKSAAVLMTWQAQRYLVNLKPALWSHWDWATRMTQCPHDGTYVPGNHRYGCLASFCLSQAVYDDMLLSEGQEDGGGVTSCPDSCQLDPSGIYWDIFLKPLCGRSTVSQRGSICICGSIFSISNPLSPD